MLKELISVSLGVGVASAGMVLKKRMIRNKAMVDLTTMLASGMVGFGMAYVINGSIDAMKNLKE